MSRVCIGLPVYNGERFISETIDSLLSQTFEDFELFISDNASTDRTEEICRAYSDKDPRISYLRNSKNLGASRNYRRVFELCSCEYFRWANCDDLFAAEGLARCVEILDLEPSVVLTYPKTKLIDENGKVIGKWEDNLDLRSSKASERFDQVLSKMGLVNILYGLMRTDILGQTGLLRNFSGGDIPLVAELSLYGKFWEIPEYLFFRRFHQLALSAHSDDVAAIQEFFDPNTIGKLPLVEWKHLIAHTHSVMHAPLTIAERMRIGYSLIYRANWRRNALGSELYEAMGHAIHRFS